MKKLLFGALMILCALSHAADVRLDNDHIDLSSNKVTLIRDAKTPSKIKLSVPVPLTYNICVRHDTHMVYGPHESCGYDTIWKWECRDVCVRSKPCDMGYSSCGCQEWENRCDNYPTNVMRSCNHPEVYCAEYGQQVNTDVRKVTLNFKDAKDLKDSEEEKFVFALEQKYEDSANADLSFTDVSNFYKIKTSEFFGFRVIVKQK